MKIILSDNLADLKCERLNEECDAKNEKEWTSLNELHTGYAAESAIRDGFFGWVEWERLFRLSWAFSNELNGDGLFKWVEWERLFRLG